MNKEAVLNNKRLITLISCLASIALTFAGLAVFSLFELNQWTGVGIGGGVFLVCAVFAIAVKKHAYIPVSVFNALATGIAISSMYTHFNFFPPVWQLALVTVGTALLFCVFCLLTKLQFVKKHFIISTTAYLLTVLTAEILLAVFVSPYVFGFALFLYLTFIVHIIVLTAKIKNFNDLIKNLAICSFTLLILVVIVVLIVITEGDGVGDVLSGVAPSKDKKQKRDPYNFEFLK